MQIFKMNKALFIFFTVFYFLSSGIQFMVTDQGHKPSIGSKAFKRIKQLAGNLEGEGDFSKGLKK